jgi:ABC-type antimicrobial peptide transport system permease subunit
MALGACAGDVLKLVARQGLALALAGVAIGLGGASVVTRTMENLLFKVGATDPLIFVSVPLLLAAVTMLAALVPARLATKVDPLVALRSE